jgi:hypothetical protein
MGNRPTRMVLARFEVMNSTGRLATGRGPNRIGANQAPPAASILTAVPVVAATISHSNPVVFKNGGCNQSLIVTGRIPLYLTAL